MLRNRDQRRIVEDLQKLDEDLRVCAVESLAMRLACEQAIESGVSFKALSKRCEFAVYSLRTELLRQMLGAPALSTGGVLAHNL